MFKYHASQDTLSRAASVTLRLFPVAAVLLVSFPDAFHTCQFSQNPISTTFNRQIANLAKWILRDYPISITTNLKPDSWCSVLWRLHFMKKELERMRDVAGEDLVAQIDSVQTEVHFLSSCSFTVSTNCLMVEQTNASRFLLQLAHQINVLRIKLTGQKVSDFSNCSQILCVPAVSMPGSDFMTTAGPSQSTKVRGRYEERRTSTASTTNTTLASTTKMMGSHLRKTREETTDVYSEGSAAAQDSETWRRRAHIWLGISIFFLTITAMSLVYWRCRSAQRERNSATLELLPFP